MIKLLTIKYNDQKVLFLKDMSMEILCFLSSHILFNSFETRNYFKYILIILLLLTFGLIFIKIHYFDIIGIAENDKKFHTHINKTLQSFRP